MVPAAQSIRLAEALRKAGASVELELVPGATHFWKGASEVPAIIGRSIEFLRAQASAGQPQGITPPRPEGAQQLAAGGRSGPEHW
jgi:acetyl esterase/lipase